MNRIFILSSLLIILFILIIIPDPEDLKEKQEKESLIAKIDSLQRKLEKVGIYETKPADNKLHFFTKEEKKSFESALQKLANDGDFTFMTPTFKNRFIINVFSLDQKEFKVRIRVNSQETAQSSFADYSIIGIYTVGEKYPEYGTLHIEDRLMVPHYANIRTDRVAAVLCDFGHRQSERLIGGLNINQIQEYEIKSSEFDTEIQEFMQNSEIRHRFQQEFIVQSVLDAYYYKK